MSDFIRLQIKTLSAAGAVPLDVDFELLADHEMTGGNIQSAVFRAASRAALRDENKRIINQADLEEAVNEELDKSFGQYSLRRRNSDTTRIFNCLKSIHNNTTTCTAFLRFIFYWYSYDRACLIKDFCSGSSLDGNLMENSITKSPLVLWSLCDTIPSPLTLFFCPGLETVEQRQYNKSAI